MSGYGAMGSEGQQNMDEMKDNLAQKAGDVMDQAKEQTGQMVEKARGSAFQAVDQQKHRAADSLGSVAQALRQTGDSLHSSDQGALGQYADRAADAIEQFSSQLHDKSVEELLSDAERFARREPELFLGGAVLLGLLASRFLKASARRSQMRNQDYDYGYNQYGYGGQYGYQGDYGRSYQQGQSGRSNMGPGGYDRGTWRGEGIDYRSAGTGGYRTTISSGTSSGAYTGSGSASGAYTGSESFDDMGDLSADTTSDDMSFGQARATSGRRQQRSGSTHMGGDRGDTSLRHDEEGTDGFNSGSSQA